VPERKARLPVADTLAGLAQVLLNPNRRLPRDYFP